MIKNEHIKWVSVAEALPHTHERVLVVCINRQNKMERHVSICEFWGARHEVLGGVYIKPMWSGHKEVTHWAPLPELPKEEEK